MSKGGPFGTWFFTIDFLLILGYVIMTTYSYASSSNYGSNMDIREFVEARAREAKLGALSLAKHIREKEPDTVNDGRIPLAPGRPN